MEKGIYKLPDIESSSDFEMIADVITVISMYRKVKGYTTKVVRKKLVTLLTLYVIYGFSKETKERAAKILGCQSKDINGFNHELRTQGFLMKVGEGFNVEDELNPILKNVSEYYKQAPKGVFSLLLNFKVEHE